MSTNLYPRKCTPDNTQFRAITEKNQGHKKTGTRRPGTLAWGRCPLNGQQWKEVTKASQVLCKHPEDKSRGLAWLTTIKEAREWWQRTKSTSQDKEWVWASWPLPTRMLYHQTNQPSIKNKTPTRTQNIFLSYLKNFLFRCSKCSSFLKKIKVHSPR